MRVQGGASSLRGSSDAESPLPLSELERALGPVRRVVRFALTPHGHTSARYLGANLRRMVARVREMVLPEALSERLLLVDAFLDGLDEDDEEGRTLRLSSVCAELARIDFLLGLPVPLALEPVAKGPWMVQEPAPNRPERPERPERASIPRQPPEPLLDDDEEDEDGPPEFAGDLGAFLGDLPVPDVLVQELASHGVHTFRDLALLRPTWSDPVPVHGAGRTLGDGWVAVGGRLRLPHAIFGPGGRRGLGSLLIGAGTLRVEWGEPTPDRARLRDSRAVVFARHEGGALRAAELVSADERGVILPQWGLPGIEDRALRHVWNGISELFAQVRDPVSADVLRRLDLPTLGTALEGSQVLHTEAARRRHAFDELLVAQLAVCIPRGQAGRERGIAHFPLHGSAARLGQIYEIHEIQLYDDAQLQLEEIKRDLRRSTPMRRVMTGEVGAGKGLVALLAASMVAEGKCQVLVLAPTVAEAEHRFVVAEPLLRDGGLVGRLINGSPSRAQLDAIKRGEVHVIFGAIDVLQQEIEYRRLGLVIANERERFGRVSALHATLPAPRPDLLVIPSVPVGARVLLTAYADHALSVLRDPHRRPAVIHLCRAEERAEAYRAVREQVQAGQQALVVFPLVDGIDAMDIPEAARMVRALEGDVLAGLRVGLLHGAMSREERSRIYDDLVHRRLDVLVTTTTFEEGPAVPSVCTVVIEQADRVDQIRLHRVIGHMSRAEVRANAYLVVGEMADPGAAARIDRVLSAPNGFQLTEALVELRGIDSMIAPASVPYPRFQWFDPSTDLPLLFAAREEAHRLVRADATLRRGTHLDLAREIAARWNRLYPDAAAHGLQCPVRDEAPPEPRRRRRRRRRRRQ